VNTWARGTNAARYATLEQHRVPITRVPITQCRHSQEVLLVNSRARSQARTPFRLPAAGTLRGLSLRVRDLAGILRFYTESLGIPVRRREGDRAELAPEGGAFTLEIVHAPKAPARVHPSIGLYHFALLLPDRARLAAVIRRLLEAQQGIDGASDHGVSEAFYLRDPEGNGIELYRDRPRDAWPFGPSGIEMGTAPLDVDRLLAEAEGSGPLSPATRFGHIHLHVGDLTQGERFYAGAMGLDVTQRSYPGALFLSAGGYHHHVGLNTWARGRRSPDGATGLIRYAWAIPAGTLDSLRSHLGEHGVPFEDSARGITVTDPVDVRVDVMEAGGGEIKPADRG
jgi:catechol 2,3-dioxygenase